MWGTLFAMSGVLYDADTVATKGFFHGFTLVTLMIILLLAGGGLIVAVVVKYTSTIIKGFATSMGIVLTSILSLFLFDVRLGVLFWIGTTVVVIATFNYNEDIQQPQPIPDAHSHTNGSAHSDDARPLLEHDARR